MTGEPGQRYSAVMDIEKVDLDVGAWVDFNVIYIKDFTLDRVLTELFAPVDILFPER